MKDASKIYDRGQRVVREWLAKQDGEIRKRLVYAQVQALESLVVTALIEAELDGERNVREAKPHD